ncbi:ribosomal protein S7 [Schizopora paradoxa]|uniref:Ribosomal protein S7 n=1 Tax=Schizopora paradoxa TaxID=27342 RepID=A0A0H2RWQ4_9AGAM|nr:ribosomal protein S7 [Schizopora paradoxa]
MLSTIARLFRSEASNVSRGNSLSRRIITAASSTPSNPSFPMPLDEMLPDDALLSRNASGSKPKQQPLVSHTDLPDHQIVLNLPLAEDPLLHYLASSIMQSGKRHAAQRRVRRTLLHLHAFTRLEPLPLLRKAVELAAPSVRVVTHKSGGKSTSIPVALNEKQRARYALQAILKASNSKSGKTLEERLAREVIHVLGSDKDTNAALKNKDTLHKFAMVNRGNIKEPR